LLKKSGIPHQVLNAKQHERESRVVAQAGRKGAVTVATNMAGRGTDILLGGNPEQMTRDHFSEKQAGHAVRRRACRDRGMTPLAATLRSLLCKWFCFSTKAKFSRCPRDQWKPVYDQFAEPVQSGARRSGGPRRIAHSRHGTPRSAPD